MTNFEIRDQVALDYLKGSGFAVLDRNWEGTEGTLDVVFVEDPHRRSNLELVVAAITSGPTRLAEARIKRMRRLAVAWMNEHGKRYDRVRVDVVSVRMLAMGQSNLEHVRGVDR